MISSDQVNEGAAAMGIGARITELRLKKRESLQQVAEAVGVSKAHIWELEKGRTDNPSMALVTRLADHFGVSVAFLVGEDVEAPDADVELQRMFRQAQQLDDRERAIIDTMMKTLLESRPRS
jgi:transcriptional regulator with XRE-family HTH domain